MKNKIKYSLIGILSFIILAITPFIGFSQVFRLVFANEYILGTRVSYTSSERERISLFTEIDHGRNIQGNTFIVPKNGIYHFDVSMNFTWPIVGDHFGPDPTGDPTRPSNGDWARWSIYLYNGDKVIKSASLTSSKSEITPEQTLALSTLVQLYKGDQISMGYGHDAAPNKVVYPTSIEFSGFKVADLLLKFQTAPSKIR